MSVDKYALEVDPAWMASQRDRLQPVAAASMAAVSEVLVMNERSRSSLLQARKGAPANAGTTSEVARRLFVMLACVMPRQFGFALKAEHFVPIPDYRAEGVEDKVPAKLEAEWNAIAALRPPGGVGGPIADIVSFPRALMLYARYGKSWVAFRAYHTACVEQPDPESGMWSIPPRFPPNDEFFLRYETMFTCEDMAYNLIRRNGAVLDLRRIPMFGRLGKPDRMPIVRAGAQAGYHARQPTAADASERGFNILLCEDMALPVGLDGQSVVVPLAHAGYAVLTRDLQLLSKCHRQLETRKTTEAAVAYLLMKEWIKETHVPEVMSEADWNNWKLPYPISTPPDVATYIQYIGEQSKTAARQQLIGQEVVSEMFHPVDAFCAAPFPHPDPVVGIPLVDPVLLRRSLRGAKAVFTMDYRNDARLDRLCSRYSAAYIQGPPHISQQVAAPET